GPAEILQSAQRREPLADDDGLGVVIADAEHADRPPRLIANRRQRERAVEIVLAPVAGHDDAAAANDQRRVAREHLADLVADRVPDFSANLVRRPSELAAVP